MVDLFSMYGRVIGVTKPNTVQKIEKTAFKFWGGIYQENRDLTGVLMFADVSQTEPSTHLILLDLEKEGPIEWN